MNMTVRFTLFLAGILLLVFSASGCKPVVNEFAFHPDTIHVVPSERLPDDIKEITIKSGDGVLLTSLYLPSPNSKKLLIYFHGNAGNIYHRIPDLRLINRSGINVIGVEYRGYGKSSGSPSEDGIYLDGEAALKYAVENLGFSEGNIILFGRSIGTAVAVNTAQHRKLDGVILVSPLTNAHDEAKAAGLGSVASLAGDAFDNLSKIDNIEAPLLVIHGTSDNVIPYSMGVEIFNRAKAKKYFVRIDGGNHNDLQNKFARQYWPPIISFIGR